MLGLLLLAGLAFGADVESLWPSKFPDPSRASVRKELTRSVRGKKAASELDGAVALFPKNRDRAGMLVFKARGQVHACEALGRGKTAFEPKPGWLEGEIAGKKIWYAPGDVEGGLTLPGVYELRNITTKDYIVKLLNKDVTGDEALAERLAPDGDRPRFTGVWKSWYPRDPKYAANTPIDMVWSESQKSPYPIREYDGPSKKDPAQIEKNPRYYFGPYGRSGFAVHTDRWEDPGADASKDEAKSFLFRNTDGCVKVRPDCLALLNAFVDEQGGTARLVVRELP
jgi:hypothetical protein